MQETRVLTTDPRDMQWFSATQIVAYRFLGTGGSAMHYR